MAAITFAPERATDVSLSFQKQICLRAPRTLRASLLRLIAFACVLLPGHWIHPSTAGRRMHVTIEHLTESCGERGELYADSSGQVTNTTRGHAVAHDTIV